MGVQDLGVFRDPVRSTKKKVVYASGVRWLTMALVIPVPWAKRQWASPFLSVALLSPKTSAKLGKRHRTSVARVGRLLSQVRRWPGIQNGKLSWSETVPLLLCP